MSAINYIFIAAFVAFIFNRTTRITALIILASYLYYYFIALQFNDWVRFPVLATGELIAGSTIILLHNNKRTLLSVGYLCIASIFCNITGWILYENNFDSSIYNALGLSVMVLQLIAMLWSLRFNVAIYSIHNNRRIFYPVNNNL